MRSGASTTSPSVFPEPPATIAALKARGFRVVTHEYPVVHEGSPLYVGAIEQGFLLDEGYARVTPATRPSTNYCEGQRFIDFEDPAAGRWWWDAHRGLNADGVDGWWLDGGEGPTAPDVLSRPNGAALHNRFDLLRQQAFANGEARDNPDRRPFLLCRSGGAGMQRFGAACWSGDINNTWATLEAQASLGLNTGLSGVPLWGTDIGGFYPVAPQSGELFARWFQFGSFNPSVSLPWSTVAHARAVGLRTGDRGDLPALSRPPVQTNALHLHPRPRGARDRHTAHAYAGFGISGRP